MNLDDKSIIILKDIFKLTRQTKTGVDALHYRANRDDQLDLIDKLERDGYLRKENEQYWVSLVGISLLDDDDVTSLLSKCEKIFDVLRKYYKSSPHDQLKLIDLSGIVEMPVDEIRECLSYMVEGSWWGSRSDFYASEDAFIKPSESILRYKSFRDVIDQLQEWARQRISDRMNQERNMIRNRASSLFKGQQNMIRERTARQKPDWYEKLDSEYQALLDEAYLALTMEMRALPAMGLRTVIDMICNKLVGDIGGFAEKLTELQNKGHISPKEKEILAIAVDVGHASAHRGHTPNKEDLNTLLDIVEHILKRIYVLHPASQRLKETTPKRNTKV